MKKIILSITLCVAFLSNAQIDSTEIKEIVKYADKLFEEEKIDSCISYVKQNNLKLKKNNFWNDYADLNCLLTMSYYIKDDIEEAIFLSEEIIFLEKKT